MFVQNCTCRSLAHPRPVMPWSMVRNMCLRESIKQTISFGSRFLIQTKCETAFKEPQKVERQGHDSSDFSFYRSTVEYSARFCGANWCRSFAAFLPCGIATGGGEMHRHSCLQQKNDSAAAMFMLCSLHLLHIDQWWAVQRSKLSLGMVRPSCYMGLLPEVVKPPIHPPSHSPIHAFNQSMIDSLVHPIHFFKRSPMHQDFFCLFRSDVKTWEIIGALYFTNIEQPSDSQSVGTQWVDHV